MSTKVLFWDIDGTLLTTGRAGIFAWEKAVETTVGADLCFQDLRTAGLTDVEIAEKILEEEGIPRSTQLVHSLVTCYEANLPESLPKRAGRVLTGVEALLRELDARGGYLSMLLTGNTRTGAYAKLKYYGLAGWFSIGSFSDIAHSKRKDVAAHAADLARKELGPVEPFDMFVIGDTPHDIACGKAIGARTIAVATGEYSVEDLRRLEPWQTLARIGDPESFISLLSAV